MAQQEPVRKHTWPGPRGHWLLGCVRQLQSDPLTLYRTAWQEYGDYVRLRAVPGFYFYLLTHPDAIEHVLYKNHKNYRKPDVLLHPARLLFGNGIFSSEGEFWLRQRRLMQPTFLRQQLARFGAAIVLAAEQLAHTWQQADSAACFDIVPEMMTLSLRIAGTSLFSTDIGDNDVGDSASTIGQAYRIAFAYINYRMNSMFPLPLWIPSRRNREFKQARALLDRVVLELIEARRRAYPQRAHNDFLDMLLAAQDEESGKGMSDQQLKDEIITLLTAGHETIGATLSWAWYLLAEHPQIQEDLHDEVRSCLAGRSPTADDLPKLPLATAIFEETMRLYPAAWGIPREAIHEDEINGYPVPAKAIFTLAQFITHRHPAFWQEPDRFEPGRFLDHSQKRPKGAYFPFGGGPRICIGNHFSLMEGPLVLATLAQRFHFSLTPGQTVVPDATFTLRPKMGVKVLVRKRT